MAMHVRERNELAPSLTSVGFFAGGYPNDPTLPRAQDCVDETWDEGEKAAVIAYLQGGEVFASYRGMSTCRICGIHNGSQERTDRKFLWPSGYAHYVEAHSVKPPQALIAAALAS